MSECAGCDTCSFSEPQKELIYEIHITVDHRETFVEDCYSIGVKPIIIDMGEDIQTHSMTTSTLKDSNDTTAFVTAHSIAKALEDIGYEVKRVKIETVPWHPKASSPEPEQYFETHFAVKVPYEEKVLNDLSSYYGLHKSRNILKKDNDTVQMVTYRAYGINNIVFSRQVNILQNHFARNNLKLSKTIIEFALYDSNEKMDDPWLKSSRR